MTALSAPRQVFSLLVGASLLALASLVKIGEDDIYMQIRAGNEILSGLRFRFNDDWSFTANGTPWANYYWLPTVLFSLVHRWAGDVGLSVMRALIVFSVFALLGHAWLRLRVRALILAALLPLAYLICAPRLQLRPETFGFALFVLLLISWSEAEERQRRYWLSPLIVCAWANVHGGTAVVGVFVAGVFLFFDLFTERRRLALASACGCALAFFATPIHWRILPVLAQHSAYNTDIIWNAEWEPLSLKHFNPAEKGFAASLWLGWTLAGVWALWRTSETNGVYRGKLAAWLVAAVLLWLSVERVRMLPYLTLFLALPLAVWCEALHPARMRAAGAALAVTGGCLLAFSLYQGRGSWGPGRSELVFPEPLFEFVARHRPEGPMFSSFAVANYQLLRLPEYKVFVDPRDVIFDEVKLEYKRAFSHPDGMKALLAKYRINTVFIELPKQAKTPDGRLIDALAFFFPREDWALVAFSDQKCVLVRRIDAHRELIEKNEYHVLRPTLEPSESLNDLGRARWEAERCVALVPKHVFCNLILAQTLLQSRDPAEYARGRAIFSWLPDYAHRVSSIDAAYVDAAGKH